MTTTTSGGIFRFIWVYGLHDRKKFLSPRIQLSDRTNGFIPFNPHLSLVPLRRVGSPNLLGRCFGYQIYINERTRIMVSLSFKKEAFTAKKRTWKYRLKIYSKSIKLLMWEFRSVEKYTNMYKVAHDPPWAWFSDHEDNRIIIVLVSFTDIRLTKGLTLQHSIITGYVLNNYRDCYDNYRDCCDWQISIVNKYPFAIDTSQL